MMSVAAVAASAIIFAVAVSVPSITVTVRAIMTMVMKRFVVLWMTRCGGRGRPIQFGDGVVKGVLIAQRTRFDSPWHDNLVRISNWSLLLLSSAHNQMNQCEGETSHHQASPDTCRDQLVIRILLPQHGRSLPHLNIRIIVHIGFDVDFHTLCWIADVRSARLPIHDPPKSRSETHAQ